MAIKIQYIFSFNSYSELIISIKFEIIAQLNKLTGSDVWTISINLHNWNIDISFKNHDTYEASCQ